MQVAAVANGLHQLLLNCVADMHALLALKAFEPSQPAPTSNMAQIARTDRRQSRAAARTAKAATKAPRGKTAGISTALEPAVNPYDLQKSGDFCKTPSCVVVWS